MSLAKHLAVGLLALFLGSVSLFAVQPTYNYSDRSVSDLLALLESTNAEVRWCAAIFIGDRYRNPNEVIVNGPIHKTNSLAAEFPIPQQLIPALVSHLKNDTNWGVKACVITALRDLRFRTNTTSLVAYGLEDKDILIRIRACTALIDISHDYKEALHTKVIPTLIVCLDPKGQVEEIWQAAYAAEDLGTNGTAVISALEVLTVHKSPKVRHYAEHALSKIQTGMKR